MSKTEKGPLYFDEMYPDELRQCFNESVDQLGMYTALRVDGGSDTNRSIYFAHDQALAAQELGSTDEELAWLAVHQGLETKRINLLNSLS